MSTVPEVSKGIGRHAVTMGMPLFGLFPGDVYWVDSNGGGGSKGTFVSPVSTLAAGIALCTANNGDYVMIKPGHTETITGAGGIAINVAGVSIVGLGSYTSRPTFLMDGGTTVTCLVTAANCAIYNCLFKAGHSDIVTFGTITAKGFICDSCQWKDNTTSENFLAIWNCGVADHDFDGLQLLNNTFDSRSDAETLIPINLLKASRDVKINGNFIQGDFDTSTYACIYSANTIHHYNIEIAYNQISNAHTANGAICISVGSTSSTGFMHNNYAAGDEASSSTPFVTADTGIGQFNNLYSGDDSTSGYVLPAIGSDA